MLSFYVQRSNFQSLHIFPCGLTVSVTGAGAGVDSAWEQKKLEARKMLVNRAESPASGARFVGTLLT